MKIRGYFLLKINMLLFFFLELKSINTRNNQIAPSTCINHNSVLQRLEEIKTRRDALNVQFRTLSKQHTQLLETIKFFQNIKSLQNMKALGKFIHNCPLNPNKRETTLNNPPRCGPLCWNHLLFSN